jgi:hypothetical protein
MSDENSVSPPVDVELIAPPKHAHNAEVVQLELVVAKIEETILAATEDGFVDEVEQAAINAELDALHAKLAKALGLNERELELLGMEPPAKRKARFDERSARAKKTKPDAAKNDGSAGAQQNKRTIKVGVPE